jgi:hypothetical protein
LPSSSLLPSFRAKREISPLPTAGPVLTVSRQSHATFQSWRRPFLSCFQPIIFA